MTDHVVEMLFSLPKGQANELVFPARGDARMTKISRTFERAVDALKLNEGITDPRQQVVFHTLRHTYASWLHESGVDLYTISKLVGHANITMTQRYSHVADTTLENAVKALQKGMERTTRGKERREAE